MDKELKVSVTLEPWFDELVEALKSLITRCKTAGVPDEVITEHLHRMIEDAAKQAVRVG